MTRSCSASVIWWYSGQDQGAVGEALGDRAAARAPGGVGGLAVRGHDAAPGRDLVLGEPAQEPVAVERDTGRTPRASVDW